MSQENVETIRDFYAATNEGDFERAATYYAEEVELRIPESIYLVGGIIKGRRAVIGWFGDWFRSFQRGSHFDVHCIDAIRDEQVLVEATFHARGRASGVEVHGPVVWLYRLDDGRISLAASFATRVEALEAAGLSE